MNRQIAEILEEIQYRIEDFQHVPYRVKHFFDKIIKILKYIPLLWKDEDWDFEYLLDLISYKLQRMRNCIYRNDILAKECQREISIGINQTIDHIHNYKNSDEVYEDLYGKFPIDIGYRFEETNDGCSRMFLTNEEAKRDLTEDEDTAYSNYLKTKIDFEQKEWKAIFDTIKEEGQKWWE